MTTYDREARTRTLARIVGPYLMVLALALFARQGSLDLMLPAFMQDGALVFAAGAFTLMAGLTMIALHHHWTSAAAAILTLIGVVAALKGAVLMIAPPLGAGVTALAVRTPAIILVVAALLLILGGWLAFVGWLDRGDA